MPIPLSDAQAKIARAFVTYVMGDMARLWATHGWNDAGGHGFERLLSDLTPAPLGYRRAMVAGRQLFYFAQAWRVSGDDTMAGRAHALYADLTGRFWDKMHGGWIFSLDDQGTPADTTKDLYTHAFVMFGLAHYASIFKQPEAIDWARRTNDLVKRHMHLAQGWCAQSARADWVLINVALEQNPHMHLLEAYLSLHAASGDAAFLHDAQHMAAIYTELLRSTDGAKVREHFDLNGTPDAKKGHLIQPGHLYEWYWLLNEYADATRLAVYRSSAAPLLAWANANGIDGQGGIFDQIGDDAVVVSARKRIWPVTECIKALATCARQIDDPEAGTALIRWIVFMSEAYFTGNGGWHEYLTRDLAPDSDFMPGSTPYHIAMAALEVDRVLGGKGAFELTPI